MGSLNYRLTKIRDLILLEKYSVLVSDFVKEIEYKREKLHCYILKNLINE